MWDMALRAAGVADKINTSDGWVVGFEYSENEKKTFVFSSPLMALLIVAWCMILESTLSSFSLMYILTWWVSRLTCV